MEIFLPTLETKARALVDAFQFVVFVMMVIGLIAHMSSERVHGSAFIAPVVKALFIVATIASLNLWYPKIEETFIAVASYIDPGYVNNPTLASDKIRESTTSSTEGKSWSWLKVNESIYQAITNALAAVFIYMGTLLTVPLLIVQYVLKWLVYILMPFAIATFMLPGFSSIGVRFLQQVLAIHAWPVGFALTNLVSLAVWNDFRNAVGANPTNLADGLYSPFLTQMGGLLAVIILIVGMISTPLVAQKLFVQGAAFSGEAGSPTVVFKTASSLLRGMGSGRTGLTTAPRAGAPRPAETPPAFPAGRPGI